MFSPGCLVACWVVLAPPLVVVSSRHTPSLTLHLNSTPNSPARLSSLVNVPPALPATTKAYHAAAHFATLEKRREDREETHTILETDFLTSLRTLVSLLVHAVATRTAQLHLWPSSLCESAHIVFIAQRGI